MDESTLSRGWAYAQLPHEARDYLSAKLSTPQKDIFGNVAAANIDGKTYYALVTLAAEPMVMNDITLNIVNDGIAQNGRVAIYDICFDSGKAAIKDSSSSALKIIADYLEKNAGKKFLIVGHTDNTGDFAPNIKRRRHPRTGSCGRFAAIRQALACVGMRLLDDSCAV